MQTKDQTTVHKVIRVGEVPCYPNKADLFCKITIDDGVLSISGVIGPMRNGDARGGCGQINMEFAHRNPEDNDKRYGNPVRPEQIEFAPEWTADLWLEFLDVWAKWHMNDLQAGCEHQRKMGWRIYDDHPCEPCPECGYKYGSAWLREELPASVIAFLQSLPDTDRQPAWV